MTWPVSEFTVVDDRTGLEQVVTVGLPVRHQSMESAPLLLCLDGPWMFGTVLDATRLMSMSGEAPEAVVVGLSFTDRSMSAYLRQRARWFTPTPFVPPPITGVKGIEAAETGRAAELQTFLADRLLPLIEAEHCGSLQITERWFIGHSFSALFGLRALLTDNTLFDKWLLASPSIWWDDRSILTVEADHAGRSDDLPARIFTSYGEHEDGDYQEEIGYDFRMGGNADDLVATLKGRNYPNLVLSHAVTPGDHHASTIGAAVSRGLRALL